MIRNMNTALLMTTSFIPAKYRKQVVVAVISILVLLIGGLGGHRIYVSTTDARDKAVSQAYFNINQALDDSEYEQASQNFEIIRSRGSEAQIVFVTLSMAAGHFENQQYEQSEQLYMSVIDLAKQSVIRDMARIRLAKVQLAQNKTQDARNTLISVEQRVAHVGVVLNSLLGDIALVEEKLLSSQASYQTALSAAQSTGNIRYSNLLEEKLALVHSLLLQEQNDTQ